MMRAESKAEGLRSEHLSGSKILSRHLDRLAIVYVRQSTLQQTQKHQESTRLQYGLVQRARELGWPRDRIVVIDDDLGRSGSSAEGRPGFQRLVAEVGLDHVGIILGIEMSRLARSCRDWHQLLEVCSVFGTLICDLDGLYDPSQYNDRLLLGLKGTMSEAELHILKQRMQEGRLHKARRGELGMRLPIGYDRRPSGEVIKDPDEQVQAVVELIFAQFAARGTINGVLRYLVEHGLRMPVRCASGANKGMLEWHRPSRVTLSNVLHNPAYAGAYAYGRRRSDPRRQQPGKPRAGRTVTPRAQWHVLLKDRLPAYIRWEQYEANLEQLENNQARAMGAPRRGPALLSGLLRCGRCGRRMTVSYAGKSQRYSCAGRASDYAEPLCQSLSGRVLDARVSELVLQALMPSALEVSLRVAKDVEAERRRLEQTWQKQLERAQYEVDRAMRQYNAVEPENRLVGRTLERQLEGKLSEQKALQQEHDRVMAQQPGVLTQEERDAIRALSADIPSLWDAATTTTMDRQMIIRQLVEQIVVTVQGDSERVDVELRWAGGHKTLTEVVRPVARLEQLTYFPALCQRIEQLRQQGQSARLIAQRLNAEGWRPPKRRATFTGAMVQSLWNRESAQHSPKQTELPKEQWRIRELAAELDMPEITLYSWLRRGWVKGWKQKEPPHHWIVQANAAELSRLRALRRAPKRGWASTNSTENRIPRA
jgi:DNA invertase Pin-like site-specific DNA recombinase